MPTEPGRPSLAYTVESSPRQSGRYRNALGHRCGYGAAQGLDGCPYRLPCTVCVVCPRALFPEPPPSRQSLRSPACGGSRRARLHASASPWHSRAYCPSLMIRLKGSKMSRLHALLAALVLVGMAAPAASIVCKTGLTDCAGVCKNLLIDAANCGACAKKCPTNAVCTSGVCTCKTGRSGRSIPGSLGQPCLGLTAAASRGVGLRAEQADCILKASQ